MVTSSADKSVAIWSFNKSVEKAAEERITIYDIFSNKVNNKFQLAVDRTNSRLQLMRQLPNAARRTNWGIAMNAFQNTFAVASGDKKVRLYVQKDSSFQLLKTFEDFQA